MVGGGECQVARAPNGSLVLDARGPHAPGAPGTRLTAWSNDNGTSFQWATPSTHNSSSVEGALVRIPGTRWLVRSHPFQYDGGGCRCNITLYGSCDSGATWQWLAQLEEQPSNVR